jgi:SagB-type dehydrogenase family enzyme
MEQIPLPEPVPLPTTLAQALDHRQSAGAAGDTNSPLLLSEAGTLFGLALRARPDGHRNYPSGGALYPIETYLIGTTLESHAPAIFHYNPTTHALEKLWDLPAQFNIKNLAKQPDTLPLSALIVFTSVWKRSSAKYGDLTYLHSLLEAGHMSENVLLVATAAGIDARPYAGFSDDKIAELLDLDEAEEQVVHTVTICKRRGTQTHSEIDALLT